MVEKDGVLASNQLEPILGSSVFLLFHLLKVKIHLKFPVSLSPLQIEFLLLGLS